jgi:hypothetical protein
MIDIKVEEEKQEEDSLKLELTEEQKQSFKEFEKLPKSIELTPTQNVFNLNDLSKELHTMNATLKDILRELKKRKV